MTSKEQRKQWEAEQKLLASLAVLEDDLDWSCETPDFPGLQRVCGVDVSFFSDRTYAIATVVILSFPKLDVLWERSAAFRLSVPYVPGFLAFREVPALSQLMSSVPKRLKPQVVLVDGNGALHPRGCGAATHLGITVDLPAIGVAKDVLQVGDVNSSSAARIAATLQPGAWLPLCPVAGLFKPKGGGKPLVVSPGHRISLSTAMRLIVAICSSASPEPIRQADLRSRRAVKAWHAGHQVEYLSNPRLRHLERMQELTDGASAEQCPKRGRWQVKAAPKLEAPPVEESLEDQEEGSWPGFLFGPLFGWMCACMSRGSKA
ncbi:unnamed protein product [Cladocopium goreaui]|uniref:Endonuclease V n=1 Tax=Cladocopium goreaui TaxID=2562237 RepID=A0A9P1DEI2_9DINO|nr:unnamed protein product [Cladocopium goreaui]